MGRELRVWSMYTRSGSIQQGDEQAGAGYWIGVRNGAFKVQIRIMRSISSRSCCQISVSSELTKELTVLEMTALYSFVDFSCVGRVRHGRGQQVERTPRRLWTGVESEGEAMLA